MKITIKMRVTNEDVNTIARFIEPGLKNISVPCHNIIITSNEPEAWLTNERKEAFEKMYNDILGTDTKRYIVEEITASI